MNVINRCKVCQIIIPQYLEYYRCCDAFVCSPLCSLQRFHSITKYDPCCRLSYTWQESENKRKQYSYIQKTPIKEVKAMSPIKRNISFDKFELEKEKPSAIVEEISPTEKTILWIKSICYINY